MPTVIVSYVQGRLQIGEEFCQKVLRMGDPYVINGVSRLQTEVSNREGYEARRVGVYAMALGRVSDLYLLVSNQKTSRKNTRNFWR